MVVCCLISNGKKKYFEFLWRQYSITALHQSFLKQQRHHIPYLIYVLVLDQLVVLGMYGVSQWMLFRAGHQLIDMLVCSPPYVKYIYILPLEFRNTNSIFLCVKIYIIIKKIWIFNNVELLDFHIPKLHHQFT